MRKLLFVVNNPSFFLSHRLPVAKAARASGYEVHVATPEAAGAEDIRAEGFPFHAVPLSRSRSNPWTEFLGLASLYALYRRLEPDIVHHVTIKPVLYGSLAARLAGVGGVCNAVSGLGYVFLARGWKAALLRAGVMQAYRLAFRHPNQKIIFQNPDDIRLFTERNLVPSGDVEMIRGSGADPEAFRVEPEPDGIPTVLFPARMLWDKGLGEFVEAAGMLRAKGIPARYVLAGDPDPGNPASSTSEWLASAAKDGGIEFLGHRKDMPRLMARANVVCLPSYREGLPKALIEAAACGRAIVTTDVPGCREAVSHGENGLLVPARDSSALAAALERLLADPALRKRMGRKGRERFDEHFSLERVVRETLRIYGSLLEAGAPDPVNPSGFAAVRPS